MAKPSFFGSVISGITGYVKGALAGGVTGLALGAVAGAVIGIFTGGIVPAALAGAAIAGTAFAGIGAIAGTMTGVVKSRQLAGPSAGDITRTAKVNFAQGVAVGQQMGQGQGASFADRIAAERASLGERVH